MSRWDTHLTSLHFIDDRYLYFGGTDESQTPDASMRWDSTNNRLEFSGNCYFVGDVTLAGTLTFGDVNVDTMILLGRMSTMTAAGSAVDINAAYINTYQELWEIRNTISNWGTKDSYKGFYFRTEADIGVADPTVANCGLRNFELYAVMDCSTTTGLSNLQNLYAEMLIKAGAGARTLVNGQCIEANLSIENQGANTLTLTNNIYGLYAKIQSGTGINDYTKLNGIRISGRDDGTVRVFGNALDICNPEATVCTWTNAINISTASAVGILLAGATTTGLKITGASTDGIKIMTGAMTDGIEVASACSAYGLNISGTATTAGVAVSGSAGIGFSVLTGTFTTGLSLAGVMSGSAISIAPPSGTTALGITLASGTITTGILIASTTVTGISITSNTTTSISITGNATTGINLATGVFGTGIAVGGTTAIGIAIAGTSSSGLTIATTPAGIWMTGVYSTAGITIQPASSTTPIGIQISGGAGAVTTGIVFGATTTGISFTTAPTLTGITMPGNVSYQGLLIGSFHTTSAGYGVIVTSTATKNRTVDVLCENTAGTVGAEFISSARFRLLLTGASYAGEQYTLHGVAKSVSSTLSSYTAGIIGTFEWATALTITGGYHGAIIGRVGGDATPALSAGSCLAGFVAGANWLSANNNATDGFSAGFAVATFSTGTWEYGLAISDSSCATGVYVGTCTTGINLAGTMTTGLTIAATATTAISALTPINCTITQTVAGPGTVRSIYGKAVTGATMTSGNLVGVRGEVTIPNSGAVSGTAFLYGAQGKLISGTSGGTASTSIDVGSSHVCGLLGQLDISNGAMTAGHIACIIASVQDTSNTLRATVNGIYVEAPTYGSGGGINSILQGNGGATTILEMSGVNSSFLLAVPSTGQTCWSAGNATGDGGKIAMKKGTDTVYVNCFTTP